MKNVTIIHRRRTPDTSKLFPRLSRKTRKAFYLEASKYLSDISKLIFGGVILTNIINFNINKTITFAVGLFAIIGFTSLSLILFFKGKE